MKAHLYYIRLMSNKLTPHKNCHPLQLENAKRENSIVLAIRLFKINNNNFHKWKDIAEYDK